MPIHDWTRVSDTAFHPVPLKPPLEVPPGPSR
jgi:hypothetical protein